ncbi:hypothetical protein T05_10304 [Trichinella murrelli]|uniref:Uncharacterized protein n=1 Tax=Trichinella murrelli TaxID=144512 RepID=A0A0V0UIW0_9BILA|nr:hypothetical protein T05_10304 [Trichinella murrelli]
MEIFKKEKKILRRLSNFQVDRQTDRQRGREAGLNNYNNATDPECGENFFFWSVVKVETGTTVSNFVAVVVVAAAAAAVVKQKNNNNNSIEAVIVGEMKEKKRNNTVLLCLSRDNDYDGKEESERDLALPFIHKYNQQAYFEKILKLFSEKTDSEQFLQFHALLRPKTNIAL